jgi:hypothetical protein
MEGGNLMSGRALKTLVLALAALCLIWVLLTLMPSGDGGQGPPPSVAELFHGANSESVREIRIDGGDREEPLLLDRVNGGWKVNGFRADSGSLARFWEALEGAEIGDLVATNPANHARLGLVPDSALTLRLELHSETRTVLVGKAGNRYGTVYVRLPDSDSAFLLEGNLRSLLTRSLSDWRNKRIATIDTARIERLELEMEGERITLVRADSIWTFSEGGEADSGTVRPILSELARLEAGGFAESEDSLSARGAALTALGQTGDTLAYLEIGSGEGERWIRARGDSVTYTIPAWRVDRLLPTFQESDSEG